MAENLQARTTEPLYYQISERLREKITSELTPGDRIPSEHELVNLYGVSRNTARLAIDLLVKQGLVSRIKGRGTFVNSERLQYGLFRLVSFSEETIRRGMRPTSRLISLRRQVPPASIARQLQLAPGQEIFRIERLRFANGQPLALNVSCLPCHLAPSLAESDLTTGSIYQLVESQYRLQIGYARQKIKPTIASDYEAGLLTVPAGSALLQVEGVAYLVDDTPIEYAVLLYRGDRYEFPIQAVRSDHYSAEVAA